jgi:hypothetical protein
LESLQALVAKAYDERWGSIPLEDRNLEQLLVLRKTAAFEGNVDLFSTLMARCSTSRQQMNFCRELPLRFG